MLSTNGLQEGGILCFVIYKWFCKWLINRDKKGGYISTKLHLHQLFPIYINYWVAQVKGDWMKRETDSFSNLKSICKGEGSNNRVAFPRQPTQSFFSHFICHLQGFGTYSIAVQWVTGLQIPLADGLQIKYLQAIVKEEVGYKTDGIHVFSVVLEI